MQTWNEYNNIVYKETSTLSLEVSTTMVLIYCLITRFVVSIVLNQQTNKKINTKKCTKFIIN